MATHCFARGGGSSHGTTAGAAAVHRSHRQRRNGSGEHDGWLHDSGAGPLPQGQPVVAVQPRRPAASRSSSCFGSGRCREVVLPADDPTGRGPTSVADIMRSYRRSYARYPRLIPLLTAHAVNSSQAFTMYNALAVTLQPCRLQRRRHPARHHPDGLLRARFGARSRRARGSLGVAAPRSDPNWPRRSPPERPKPGRADDAFEFGLAVLLRGLADFASR